MESAGLVLVHLLRDNLFILKCSSIDARCKIQLEGPHFFNNCLLILREWTPNVDMDMETLKVPVWVRVPNVPLDMWDSEILSSVGSVLGRPMYMDHCTMNQKRLKFARLLVEMEFKGEFPLSVELDDDEGCRVKLQIEYEWRPNMPNPIQNTKASRTQQWWQPKTVQPTVIKGTEPGSNQQASGSQLPEGNNDVNATVSVLLVL